MHLLACRDGRRAAATCQIPHACADCETASAAEQRAGRRAAGSANRQEATIGAPNQHSRQRVQGTQARACISGAR
eukprot:scaffold2584_cov113-Isochrysis_galbana.AAC.11